MVDIWLFPSPIGIWNVSFVEGGKLENPAMRTNNKLNLSQTQATAVPSCHSSQKGGEMQLSQHYPKRGDKSTKLICSTKLSNVTRKEHQLLSKWKKEGDLLLTTWNRELVFDFSSFSLFLSAKNRKMSETSSVPSSTRKHHPVKV